MAKDRWDELEQLLGYNNTRILAQAVSWAWRPDNWQFLGWFTYLKDDYKEIIEQYFTEMIRFEKSKMVETLSTDISALVERYKLSPIVIYNNRAVLENYDYTPALIRERSLNLTMQTRMYRRRQAKKNQEKT